MYREWKKTESLNKYYIWIWKQQDWVLHQVTVGKMKWKGEYLVEKDGKKKYIKKRDGGSSWEWQGIIEFCTCQWMNEGMKEL